MAPLTRSASTRATKSTFQFHLVTCAFQVVVTWTYFVHSCARAGGPVQARANSEPQVLWFGEENANQDIRIRVVGNKVDDDHTLALLMVYSSRLKKYSTYFSARLSPRWGSKRKRNPDEITFHIIGDVELYTDCFSRMYNPLEVGFKSVRYSLELLPVATHLGYDDLMSSIWLYLASICPWTCYEEMRIRKAVSSEDFPSGHATDLLERLERCLTRDDLRSLVTRYMRALHIRMLHSDFAWPREARELLSYLLETARKQEPGPIPTFEQEVATIINEEFKLLLVEANDEAEKKEVAGNETAYIMWDSMEGDRGMFGQLEAISVILQIMLATATAVEGVKSFVKCRSFAKLVFHEILANESHVARSLMNYLAFTVVMILKEVLDGNLLLGDSDRDELFLNWVPRLDQLYRTASDRAMLLNLRYPAVRKCLLFNQPSSRVLERNVKKLQ